VLRETWQRHRAAEEHAAAEAQHFSSLVVAPSDHLSDDLPHEQTTHGLTTQNGLMDTDTDMNNTFDTVPGSSGVNSDDDEPMNPRLDILQDYTASEQSLHDFLPQFLNEVPDGIPEILIMPLTSPNRPTMSPMTFLERALYSVLNAVAANWSVERRAMDAVLVSVWTLLSYAMGSVKRGKDRDITDDGDLPDEPHAQSNYPASKSDRALQHLMQTHMLGMYEDPPARTMNTAQNRLGRPAEGLVHPACPNEQCQRVYYDVTNAEGIRNLGSSCRFCDFEFPADPEDCMLLFPRQTLIAELERVLSVPGIEQACFSDLRSDPDADMAKYGTRVMRHQSDGALWDIRASDGCFFPHDVEIVRLNVMVDWYQTSKTAFAHSNSNGPILAHIANLPSQARGNMVLTLVLGITPGKLDSAVGSARLYWLSVWFIQDPTSPSNKACGRICSD
jgi:hypothetical protein